MPAPLVIYAKLGAALFGRFSLSDIKASECVERADVPILIIHGLADDIVPPEMSERIAAARPDMVRRIVFPGAEHGLSFLTDEERYRDETLAFLAEACGRVA